MQRKKTLQVSNYACDKRVCASVYETSVTKWKVIWEVSVEVVTAILC